MATVSLEGLWVVLGGFLAFGLALWWPRSVAPRSGLALVFTVQALAGCLSLPLTLAGSRRPDWTWVSVVALGLLLGAATISSPDKRADQLRRAPICPPAPRGRDEVGGISTGSAPGARADRVFIALVLLLLPVYAITLTLTLMRWRGRREALWRPARRWRSCRSASPRGSAGRAAED